MNWHFTDLWYWFSVQPEALSARGQLCLKSLLIAGLVILIASIIYTNWKKRDRIWAKVAGKLAYWSGTLTFFAALLYWFDYEQATILSMRAWWLVWLVGAVVWLSVIIKYCLQEVPKQKSNLQQQTEINKYLPRRKK
ncbi:MAG: hypothetical protein WCW02_03155 [Candidatus Buchananbacteria bacterium]